MPKFTIRETGSATSIALTNLVSVWRPQAIDIPILACAKTRAERRAASCVIRKRVS